MPPASVGPFWEAECLGMPSDRQTWDYEAVKPLQRAPRDGGDFGDESEPQAAREGYDGDDEAGTRVEVSARARDGLKSSKVLKSSGSPNPAPVVLRRGHSLTYAALFLFTIILYLRPADLWPSPLTSSIAFVVGTATLLIFLLTQLSLEGNLTARPREVNLVLIFCLLALLSMPLAVGPGVAWETFSGVFIRCVLIFVVMVNAVRTTGRLRGMLWVAMAAGLVLSAKAVNDYRLGNLTVEGYRVGGVGEGLFGNPNEVALFLVTLIPVTTALAFGSRSFMGKAAYAAATLLMLAAVVVTFSRGGSLGLAAALGVMAWKMGRRNRLTVLIVVLACGAMLLVIAPSNFSLRLLSVFIPSLDPVGSSDMRRQLLWQSVWTAARHPLLGIGMGNFPLVSLRSLVSHNSYTQVAAEMGLPALAVYMLFVLTPLKGLSRIERETYEGRKGSRFYYLSVGLYASLLGYMVSSFFASAAYVWYVYYVVGYAACLRRIYESESAREAEREPREAGAGEEGNVEADEDGAHAAAWAATELSRSR